MVISCRTTGCIRSVRGLARRAPNADERQLQFSGGGRALRPLAVPDPLFVGGSAAKDTGADREGQTNRGASRSESAATGPIDRGVRSRGLQRGVEPLPGDHAHDEQVWQDSGRGDRKWKGQKASGDLHQRHRRGTRGGADRAIDLSALGRGECHQGTVAQASHQLHAGLRPRGIGRATAGERKKQRAGLVSELNRLKIELADHLLEPPAKKRGTPSRSQKEVMDDIAVIEGKILLADDQLEKLPSEIRFDEAHAGEKLLKLNHEKKRFLDCIKVFVCNSKAEMCRLLLKHYDRPKEVIPALAMIVERTGYMKLEGGRLEVTLRRFTDREIDYAARHLCEDLNRMQPVTLDKFHLPIRYHVQ